MTWRRRLLKLLAGGGMALAITVAVLGHLRAMAQPPPDGIDLAACPAGPSISFTPTNPDPLESTQFFGAVTSTGGSGSITYTWNFGDGSTEVNATPKPLHAYIRSGVYTVVMTASGDTCADTPTATQVITVGFGVPAATLYFPIIFKNQVNLFPTETGLSQPAQIEAIITPSTPLNSLTGCGQQYLTRAAFFLPDCP